MDNWSMCTAPAFVKRPACTMFLTFWSTRPAVEREPGLGENLGLVWAAIPGLMVLAAATMAVMAIITERAGD